MGLTKLSVKAWHEMIALGLVSKRAELIRGVIIEKMSKSILHAKLSSRLFKYLLGQLDPLFWVRMGSPLSLTDSEPEPDISVVAGAEESHTGHPSTAILVVEIAVTTLAEDRDMMEIYAEAGVQEYWIVNATHHSIEVHRQPRNGHYLITETKSVGDILESEALPSVKLKLADLFAGLA